MPRLNHDKFTVTEISAWLASREIMTRPPLVEIDAVRFDRVCALKQEKENNLPKDDKFTVMAGWAVISRPQR